LQWLFFKIKFSWQRCQYISLYNTYRHVSGGWADGCVTGVNGSINPLAMLMAMQVKSRTVFDFGCSDWMHDTARCLGYPSDSMRAARERAPGDNQQSPCSSATRPRGSTFAPVAQLSPLLLSSRSRGSTPPWLIYRPCGSAPALAVQLSPLWLGSRPRGSTAAPWP
jgi:hypothetical protein